MKANQAAMEEMSKSWEQRLAEAKKKDEEDSLKGKATNAPHIVNLNEDSMLDRKIVYDLTQAAQVYVGRKNGDPTP